jgi:hypothetical protein
VTTRPWSEGGFRRRFERRAQYSIRARLKLGKYELQAEEEREVIVVEELIQ